MLPISLFKMPAACSTLDRPVRVCFMLDCLGVAGIECQLLLLLEHLDRSKVEPFLCLLRGDDDHSQQVSNLDGRPVLRLGIRSLRHPSVVPKAIAFARFLRRERIDVLHPLFPDSLYFGTPVAKLAGVPCVVQFRVDLNYWMTSKDRWLAKLLTPFLDGTITNCEACKQVAVEQAWRSSQRIDIIPNGLDLSRFVAPAPPCPAEQPVREKRVGVVANLRPVKNIELLVQAAALLKTSHPNARFLIAGEGESRTNIEALIRELALQDRIDLLGTVADIPTFLRTLDVAVLCSRSEGSPNSIMEYMATGLPTVATDVGGCRELIEDRQHGLLVSSEDPAQLAAAIDRLLRDSALAQRLGANARQRAFTEYGVDRQASRYETFYREILTSKRTAHRLTR